jgi:hypothetical protein
MINLYGRAHNNYAKFHYNHHRVQLVSWSLLTWSLVTWSLSDLVINLSEGAHNNYEKFHYNRISSLLTHRGQTNKQTNKHTCLFYIYTSCTLRALLRLNFNVNETLYFFLILFIEELLNIQYFLFFLLVCTRINRKVFKRVSKLHAVVHVRSMDFPNLVHNL